MRRGGAIAILLAMAGFVPAGEISFRTDVMSVLSKAGCNLGVCHGNQNGKGGFRLSLRGQDPDVDYVALTRELGGRRTNPQRPEEALILRKATLDVAHQGGKRFSRESPEYAVLYAWMQAGSPKERPQEPRLSSLSVSPADTVLAEPVDTLPLNVEATFSDGTSRDVRGRAVYEASDPRISVDHDGRVTFADFGEATVIVRYLDRQQTVRLARIRNRPDYQWNGPAPANFIDRRVFARLQELRVAPAARCSDTFFLRRVSLDLLGILPTADEARAFLDDKRPDKRARLVEAWLERPEFAECWAQKWGDLLRVEERTLDRKGVEAFAGWLRQAIRTNQPLDQFVRELIAARGSTYENPPANFYRALRDPLTRGEAAAQVFLGVRLQCAKCHNHPFAPWTQADYYGWSNVFARIDYRILENRRRDDNDKHEFIGEQIVVMTSGGDVPDPRTGQPPPPRFLGAAPASGKNDRLREVADWMTRPDNPFFARMQVNRIWYHLLGRGIVDPIDDFRPTNPPSHPQLLDELAADFVAQGFDLRHTLRTILSSETYQLASSSVDEAEAPFARNLPRRLSAEQLLDALCQVAETPVEFAGYPRGIRAGQLPGIQAVRSREEPPSEGDRFLKLFGKPPRLQSCECERSGESSLSQTLQLSGSFFPRLFSDRSGRLARLAASGPPPAELVDELYWTALSRPPQPEESAECVAYLTKASNLQSALEDIAWALVNSKEFLFRL